MGTGVRTGRSSLRQITLGREVVSINLQSLTLLLHARFLDVGLGTFTEFFPELFFVWIS
jgi:hypothetical protein